MLLHESCAASRCPVPSLQLLHASETGRGKKCEGGSQCAGGSQRIGEGAGGCLDEIPKGGGELCGRVDDCGGEGAAGNCGQEIFVALRSRRSIRGQGR